MSLDEDLVDDILYAARAGDEDLLNSIISGPSSTVETLQLFLAAKDPNSGNTAVHYAAANGHTSTLQIILAQLQSNKDQIVKLVTAVNEAGNTALHYAAINGQLEAVKYLVQALPEGTGPELKMDFMQRKNRAGHDAAFEAEIASKEEVVNWLLEHMDSLEPQGNGEESSETVEDNVVTESEAEGVGESVGKANNSSD